MAVSEKTVIEALDDVSNDGAEEIGFSEPYAVVFRVSGTTPILFHRWSCDAVEAKANAAKGSKAKKTDDVDTYVYRMGEDKNGELAIPSEYFRMSIINASKFKQDPRSPRKSAMDIMKAALACLEPLCPLGTNKWDYIDRRRVTVQRNGLTRCRPAFNTGWKAEVMLHCMLSEYVSPQFLNMLIQEAGRLVGVGDFRPTFGRFAVTGFEVV